MNTTAKMMLCILIGSLIWLNPSHVKADSIAINGLEVNHQGAADWNSTGGAESAAVGHDLSWTTQPGDVAYYYMASREYGGIDPLSTGAIRGSDPVVGFPKFSAALASGGFAPSDVTFQFGLMTLGGDQQGVDWTYDNGTTVENRYYTGGNFKLQLNGEDMLGGPMPRFTMSITYNDVSTYADDEISGLTAAATPLDISGGSSPAVQNAAAAFLQDLHGDGIRLVFDSFQPAVQFQFSGDGRTGAFFESQSGVIEAVPEPSISALTTCLLFCGFLVHRKRLG